MTQRITRAEVLALLELDEDFLLALEREQIVVGEACEYFQPDTVERIRLCQTLHHELGVNLAGIDVVLNLLEIIEAERRRFVEMLRRVDPPPV